MMPFAGNMMPGRTGVGDEQIVQRHRRAHGALFEVIEEEDVVVLAYAAVSSTGVPCGWRLSRSETQSSHNSFVTASSVVANAARCATPTVSGDDYTQSTAARTPAVTYEHHQLVPSNCRRRLVTYRYPHHL